MSVVSSGRQAVPRTCCSMRRQPTVSLVVAGLRLKLNVMCGSERATIDGRTWGTLTGKPERNACHRVPTLARY